MGEAICEKSQKNAMLISSEEGRDDNDKENSEDNKMPLLDNEIPSTSTKAPPLTEKKAN